MKKLLLIILALTNWIYINAQTSLPTSWSCENAIPPAGWTFIQTFAGATNYLGAASCDAISSLRLDAVNEALVIYFSEQPGAFSYQIGATAGGNATQWEGVFSVDESVDGITWVNIKTYQNSGELPVGPCLNETYNFANPASRYLRFFYTEKVSGSNVRLDEISINEPTVNVQTQLQYQLNQQGSGSCAGSTVTLSVSTSVNITTAVVSEISNSSATTGGNISNDGGNPVTQRGVCWSTLPNPTISDNTTNSGVSLGSFTSNLSGLSPNTLYFVRAYAINNAGVFYGNEVSFTTPNSTSANITTTDVSGITISSAISGGNISNDGGNPVTQRGVCWSTSPNPTTSDNTTNNGSDLGSFTSNLSGLSLNTLYFVRAYAINNAGVYYGNEISFTTPIEASPSAHSCGAENVHNPNLTYNSMTDQDGNVYKTIVIGNQEWMAENLKVSHYRNGDLIPNVTDNLEWESLTIGASCWYNNDSASYNCPYGKLYNWFTAADPRNVCPVGWHIPTNNEWVTLTTYLGGSGVAAGKMKSNSLLYWLYYPSYPNITASNESGFSGLPSYRGSTGSFSSDINRYGFLWSSSEYNSSSAWNLSLGYGYYSSGMGNVIKQSGFTVRCLRD